MKHMTEGKGRETNIYYHSWEGGNVYKWNSLRGMEKIGEAFIILMRGW